MLEDENIKNMHFRYFQVSPSKNNKMAVVSF